MVMLDTRNVGLCGAIDMEGWVCGAGKSDYCDVFREREIQEALECDALIEMAEDIE